MFAALFFIGLGGMILDVDTAQIVLAQAGYAITMGAFELGRVAAAYRREVLRINAAQATAR